ncbi:MAG TPA: S1/P1 nuclease [Pyrinomonadaceae bacterium]|nr:S1/P1 nuclease [Pyrinomonadaceae bacterium]
MKKTLTLFLTLTLLLGPASSALAWGEDGHRAIGEIASQRIKKRTARRIAQILMAGETLGSVASWADTVKERMGKTDPDPDTNAFLQDMAHNETNREWHYDDLALDCSSYQTCTGFTPDNDIVHMLNVSIRTLQGHPDPNHPMSQRNALKFVVHFLGDIHQPLHIGCGFLDEHGPNGSILIIRNPAVIKAKGLPSDKGANDLVIDNDRKNLHGFWDFTLVTSLMTTIGQEISADNLGTYLRQNVRPRSSWNPHGPISTWAAQWATDSLHVSRNNTYRDIRISGQRSIPVLSKGQPVIKNGQPVMQTVFDVALPANYERLNREVTRQQLAKAGYRLAKLLDAIYAAK